MPRFIALCGFDGQDALQGASTSCLVVSYSTALRIPPGLNFELEAINYGLLAPGVAQLPVYMLQITACMVQVD